MNKLLACVYRVMRSVYVCFWYYFFPFTVLFGTYSIPFVFGIATNNNTIAIDPEVNA